MNRYTSIAEYYDPEHERLEMLRHDVPFFLRQLPKRRLSVLELCAGTARAAIPIAQAGHRVVGVERDPAMLAIGRRKAAAMGLTDRELKLLRGDVLKLKLREKFDRVAIFFNTLLAFTTLDQLDRVLQNARRHLKPSGRLWIDIFHPDHSMLAERQTRKAESAAFYVPALDRTVVESIDIRRDMSRQWIRLTTTYLWFDAKGIKRQERSVIEMTAIFPRELPILLERNGFKIDKLYGDYDGKSLKADSPRMIASCRLA